MRVEWLYEAQQEFGDLLRYYRVTVGDKYARRFAEKILGAVEQLEIFPESGVLKTDTIMGRYGFRALFVDQYACIYRIDGDVVWIYHLVDARRNYIYNIFGVQ